MLKNIFAVIAGYLVFAISSFMFFKLTGQPPHKEASLIFKIATVGYGLVFAIIAGFAAKFIARQANHKANMALAILIFALAMLSMILSNGSHWTQWFAMLIFAPASLLGGYLMKSSA